MKPLFLALVTGLLMASGGGAASAQAPSSSLTRGGDAAAAVITTLEARLIRDYFRGLGRELSDATHVEAGRGAAAGRGKAKGKAKARGKSGQAPPGLAKRERLPPGLAKRDSLPPGLRGRGLPQDLSSALPRRPPGQELRMFDNDVVLLESATGRILDILRDALGGH